MALESMTVSARIAEKMNLFICTKGKSEFEKTSTNEAIKPTFRLDEYRCQEGI